MSVKSNTIFSLKLGLLTLYCTISGMISLQAQYMYDLVPYLDGRLYGYADLEGKVVIKPDFEEVKRFDSLGFADVVHYGLKGKINRKGEWAIPPMANNYTLTQVKNFDGKETVEVPGLYWVTVYNNDRMTLFNTKNYGPNNNIFYKHHRGLSYVRKDLSRYFTYETFEYGLKKVVFKDSSTNLLKLDGTFYYSKNQYNVDVLNEKLVVKALNPLTFQLYDYKDNLVNVDTFFKISVVADGKYLIASKSQYEYHGNEYILNNEGKKIITKSFYKVRYLFDDLFFVSDYEGNRIINSNAEVINVECGDEIQTACGKYLATSIRDTLFMFDIKGKNLLKRKGAYLGFGFNKNYFILTEKSNSFLYNDDVIKIFEKQGGNIYVQPGLESSDELLLSEEGSQFKTLIKTNGKVLLEIKGEIIAMPFNNTYFIRSGSKNGVFSSEKGWVYPLSYQKLEYDQTGKVLYLSKNKTTYTLDGQFREKKHTSDFYKEVYTISDMDSLFFIYPNGDIVSCSAAIKVRPLMVEGTSDRKLFYANSDKSLVYDSTFANIVPAGFYSEKRNPFVVLKNNKIGICVTNGSLIGLIDSKGKWLISPVTGQKIENKEFGFLSLQNQHISVLYNQNYEPLVVPDGQRLTILDKNRLISSQYQNGYQVFQVCDHNMKPLAQEWFSNSNYQNTVFIKMTTENGQKKTCFFKEDFRPDTCLHYIVETYIKDSIGRMIVFANDRYGIIDADKNLVAPVKYKNIEYREPFYFLHESDEKTFLLTEDNVLVDLQTRMGSVMYDEESKNYLLRNYDNGQNIMIDRKGSILSRFTGDYELLKKDDYYYFKDMLKGMDERYKPYYVNKWTGVVYRKG
jgi:hypothetical protein